MHPISKKACNSNITSRYSKHTFIRRRYANHPQKRQTMRNIQCYINTSVAVVVVVVATAQDNPAQGAGSTPNHNLAVVLPHSPSLDSDRLPAYSYVTAAPDPDPDPDPCIAKKADFRTCLPPCADAH